VVYGDIGTSALYAIRESFYGPHGIAASPSNILGVLSLVFWSLVLVVTIKYHLVIIRADNKGEGGILALMAMVQHSRLARGLSPQRLMIVLGVFGTALMYADGALTPAISVMSAVEGLEVAAPALARWVLPLTLAILLGLFAVQHHGTGRIGAAFGPVMLVWFATLAVLGLSAIAREPGVLAAVLPHHAVRFFTENAFRGFVVLGAVFLVVTGGEALYADLGHFGHRAIQLAWFSTALPGLLLNYFGQGALLLRDPAAAESPFYHLAPTWFLYPLIALATAATIIASQAVISGSFSLTRQAIQLGYCPRLRIEHTSHREIGQIYVSAVNWGLMLMTCALVLGFGSSSRIAGAYGVALSTLMVMTTVMFFVMSREVWGWSLRRAALVSGLFFAVDMAFLLANGLKIASGGWVPLAIGAVLYVLLATWKRGRQVLQARLSEIAVPLEILLGDIAADPPTRVAGTAIWMTAQPDGVPYTLLHNLRHNHVLHERNVFLTVRFREIPRVSDVERVSVEAIAEGFYRVAGHYGFMEEPDVLEVIGKCRERGLDISVEASSFFVGRETLLATDRPGMAIWREKLFALMSRNTPRATAGFNVPAGQVIEIGAQIEL
jgi:KUP system potassium uptake protein